MISFLPLFHFRFQLLDSSCFAYHHYCLPSPGHLFHFHIHPQNFYAPFYRIICNMMMIVCVKVWSLSANFVSNQVALNQHHFDIHDLTTAMEWSTPKLTDTTFPPSATWHWIVWVRQSKDGWQVGWSRVKWLAWSKISLATFKRDLLNPLYTRVFHFYTFFELSYTLLTTHAHGL